MTGDITTTYLATRHRDRVLCWVEHQRDEPLLLRLDPWPRQVHRTAADVAEAEAFIYGIDCACGDGEDCTLVHDYDGARALFSAFTARCSSCRRLLTDPYSKTVGIGPQCRHGLHPKYLAGMADRMSRALAEAMA